MFAIVSHSALHFSMHPGQGREVTLNRQWSMQCPCMVFISETFHELVSKAESQSYLVLHSWILRPFSYNENQWNKHSYIVIANMHSDQKKTLTERPQYVVCPLYLELVGRWPIFPNQEIYDFIQASASELVHCWGQVMPGWHTKTGVWHQNPPELFKGTIWFNLTRSLSVSHASTVSCRKLN